MPEVTTESYIEINRAAYEFAAPEFEQKIGLRKESDELLVPEICKYFEVDGSSADVLELGTGSGYISKLMSERGHNVTAIEFSPRMAEVARRTAPRARVITGDFLTHNFEDANFDALVGIAFIHLFKEADAQKAVAKMADLTRPLGSLVLSTTLHSEVCEGFMGKTNFKEKPLRFRRQYTESALVELVSGAGFEIEDTTLNEDSEGIAGKTWLSLVAKKPK